MSTKVQNIAVTILLLLLFARVGLYIYQSEQKTRQQQNSKKFDEYIQRLRRQNADKLKTIELEKTPCEKPDSGETDKNGLKQGLWRLCDNEYTEVGYFKNGKKEGEWKYYNPYEELYQVITFRNNKEKGPFKTFYSDGSVQSEGTMKEGHKHGEYKSYYEDGKIETSGKYFFGMQMGEWKEYYVEGTIAKSSNHLNNKLDGSTKYYGIDGKLEYEEIFEKDSLIKEINHSERD